MKEVYRSCASIVVFKKDGDKYQVLLLHKPRKKDSWQLPQGGIEEGENLEVAALRELKEEAGIEVEIIGKSESVYQYDFPPSYRRFRPDNVCGQRLEFIFAVPIEEDVQVIVDRTEVDAFAWVAPEELGEYIKRKEYLEFVEKIVGEGTVLWNGLRKS